MKHIILLVRSSPTLPRDFEGAAAACISHHCPHRTSHLSTDRSILDHVHHRQPRHLQAIAAAPASPSPILAITSSGTSRIKCACLPSLRPRRPISVVVGCPDSRRRANHQRPRDSIAANRLKSVLGCFADSGLLCVANIFLPAQRCHVDALVTPSMRRPG